jgi:hypothetical protein
MSVSVERVFEDNLFVVAFAVAFGLGTVLASRPLFTTLDAAFSAS